MNYGTSLLFAVLYSSQACASGLIEPHMRLKPMRDRDGKHVALTLDACTGQTDERILSALIDHEIKATIFVTARWLKRNPAAISALKAHPDLFEIENHGAKHVPAVDKPMDVFGIPAAGSPAVVASEVEDGAAAVNKTFGHWPHWYRGAAAEYSSSAINLIETLNFKIAGFSLSGDGGASYSQRRAANAVASAQDGDIIIAHLNQPLKPAGAGVVEGLLKLKAEGFTFLRLNDHE